MDKKIVSTTYVPLQPPYQIIKYTGDIAMQIGTLIVTIQKEGNVNGLGYEIETHSHPVVAYENKFKTEPNHQLTAYQFLEGAVWNFVEVKDVTTICLSNSRLPWKEFIDFLWRDVERRQGVPEPTIAAFWSLDKLCGGVDLPEAKDYIIHFEIHNIVKDGQTTSVLRSRADDVFAFQAEINKDLPYVLGHQYMNYIYIWTAFRTTDAFINLTYETDDEELRDFVRKMNVDGIKGFSAKDRLIMDHEQLAGLLKSLDDYRNNGFVLKKAK